jgi:hypothetical protein
MKLQRASWRAKALAVSLTLLGGLLICAPPAGAQATRAVNSAPEAAPAEAGAPETPKAGGGEADTFCLPEQSPGGATAQPPTGAAGGATTDGGVTDSPAASVSPPPGQAGANGGFRWGAALKQSLLFLSVEHGFRLATEPGTRAELRGPFFKDWLNSAQNLHGWRDGDPFYVNYVGHAMQGAVTGFIQIQNDPRVLGLKPGLSREYVRSRLRAFGWNTLYSTQFELGPLSESSIGNVGLRPSKTSRHPQAFVDLVVTPVVGTAWLVGEDVLDRFLVRRIEAKTPNRAVRLLARSFLNPGRSFANLMRGKWFWYRDDRRL